MSNLYAPFLAQVHLLQHFTAGEMQSILDYFSSRARAAGNAWNNRGPSLSPEKRRAFATELYYDLVSHHSGSGSPSFVDVNNSDRKEMGMMIYSTSCLRFPDTIRRPIALAMMFKTALTGTLSLSPHLLAYDPLDASIPDPILPKYVHDWWNQDQPYDVTLQQLIEAWREQRAEFEAMKVDTRPRSSLEKLLKGSVDDKLLQAAQFAQTSINLVEEDLNSAMKTVQSISASIAETEKFLPSILGASTSAST